MFVCFKAKHVLSPAEKTSTSSHVNYRYLSTQRKGSTTPATESKKSSAQRENKTVAEKT